jgi:hypothetical protein
MTTTRKPPARKPQVTVIPADVKQPEDRKTKAADVEETEEDRIQALADSAVVVEVDGGSKVTLNGFTVLIPEGARDDFELLAEVGMMDQKIARGRGPSAMAHFPAIMRALAGDDGYRTVLNAMRGDNGRVPVEPAIDYVLALLTVMQVTADEDEED